MRTSIPLFAYANNIFELRFKLLFGLWVSVTVMESHLFVSLRDAGENSYNLFQNLPGAVVICNHLFEQHSISLRDLVLFDWLSEW
jgi:hypothetical protein